MRRIVLPQLSNHQGTTRMHMLHYVHDFSRPTVFLRWSGAICFQLLPIAGMTLLLIPLDCQYYGRPSNMMFQNQARQDLVLSKSCWESDPDTTYQTRSDALCKDILTFLQHTFLCIIVSNVMEAWEHHNCCMPKKSVAKSSNTAFTWSKGCLLKSKFLRTIRSRLLAAETKFLNWGWVPGIWICKKS